MFVDFASHNTVDKIQNLSELRLPNSIYEIVKLKHKVEFERLF